MSPRGFHLRWWHWLLVVACFLMLLIAAVMLGLRLYGERRYDEVTDALRTAGKPIALAQLVAGETPLDEKVQEQWALWTAVAASYLDAKFSQDQWNRFVIGLEDLSPAMRKDLDDHRIFMQPARDLLADGRVRVGFAPLIHRMAVVEPVSFADYSRITSRTIGEFLAIRPLARWLADEAVVADDPRPALVDLERLHQQLRTPYALLDAMIQTSVAEARDRAYCALALRGRLPDDLRLAWLAEPPDHQRRVAHAYDCERVASNHVLARTIGSLSWTQAAFSADPFGIASEPWTPLQVLGGTWTWSTTLADCATVAEVEAHISARLRRERFDPISATADSRLQFFIARLSLPSLLMVVGSPVSADTNHRLERLAVRLVSEAPQHGLPRDEADLLTRHGPQALAAVDDLLALRYERLADDRFRLSIDPATPVPDFADAAVVRSWTTAFGQPAAGTPLHRRNGCLEIQLPAVLRRP